MRGENRGSKRQNPLRYTIEGCRDDLNALFGSKHQSPDNPRIIWALVRMLSFGPALTTSMSIAPKFDRGRLGRLEYQLKRKPASYRYLESRSIGDVVADPIRRVDIVAVG